MKNEGKLARIFHYAVRGFFSGSLCVAGMQVSTNEANSLALALAIRPVGKTAQRSMLGSQSFRTALTMPDANFGSEVPLRCNGNAEVGKHRLPQSLRRGDF
jgi:hypothetical protein